MGCGTPGSSGSLGWGADSSHTGLIGVSGIVGFCQLSACLKVMLWQCSFSALHAQSVKARKEDKRQTCLNCDTGGCESEGTVRN